MIGTQVQHFRVLGKLGEGGMGEVFVAEDTKLKRKVALKFLPPHYSQDDEFKARFEHEATAAAALNHPNIITVYELGEHEGRMFIAMELIEGRTLDHRIRADDIQLTEAVDIAQQVCEGLNAAHEAGIVHRDIKPANIFVADNGRVKILDFGLAKSRRATTETKAGTTVGTIQYESPEQSRGDKVDRRSDLFSVGVVLYEMITSRRPFRGEFEDAIRYAIANETPEPLARYKADASDDLQRIVSKLLEKDPDLRYQVAAGVVSDLKLLKRSSGPHTSAVHSAMSTANVLAAPAPKRRLLSILAPGAVAVIAVILALVFQPWRIVIEPTQEASAMEDRLAVMYFENLVDPDDPGRLGKIITNLLITDMSESQYIKVVSSQRLYDILKLLGREGATTVNEDVATQIAQKAQARWMLLGSILQVEPQMVITAQLVEVATGNVLASEKIRGQQQDVFGLVDRLTSGIKQDLALPAGAQDEPQRNVIELTTASTDAYRYYLEGRDYDRKLMYDKARSSYQSALQ